MNTEDENAQERNFYHSIYNKNLFYDRGLTNYDRNHPDEQDPSNHPLVLYFEDKQIGKLVEKKFH